MNNNQQSLIIKVVNSNFNIIMKWLCNQIANFISSSNIRIKEKKIIERFKVFSIDEFITSCLNYKTHWKLNNLWLSCVYNKAISPNNCMNIFINYIH